MANKEELDKKKEEIKKKGKGFVEEFKDFVLRGNVVDMAIGVIIGAAFQGLVTAFTEDFINPLINGLGGAEFGGTIKIYGGQVIKYGDFITSVINFLIMAFILFLMLKFVNHLTSIGKKKVEAAVKSDETIILEEIRDFLKKSHK